MRSRDEIEDDIRKGSAPSSGLMNTEAVQQISLEVLLDIRDLLNGIDTRIESSRSDMMAALTEIRDRAVAARKLV